MKRLVGFLLMFAHAAMAATHNFTPETPNATIVSDLALGSSAQTPITSLPAHTPKPPAPGHFSVWAETSSRGLLLISW
jgi:hypothetical protein